MKGKAQQKRHHRIRQRLAQEGSLRVEDLARELQVTPMTVRRDLAALEEIGVLVRTHGGCTIQSPMVRQLSFSERDSLRGDEKSAIAAEAVKLVEPGSALFVDTGTTALHFARVLPATLDLRVFTNNLRVAMDLFGRPGFEVIVYGGRLAGHSPDLVGEIALTRVQDFRLDLAILGADAVDPARGEIFASDIPTASLDRAVLRQAAKVAVLADSTKLRRQSLAAITQLTEGLTLVTDSGASPQDIEMLQATGAEITIAGAA